MKGKLLRGLVIGMVIGLCGCGQKAPEPEPVVEQEAVVEEVAEEPDDNSKALEILQKIKDKGIDRYAVMDMDASIMFLVQHAEDTSLILNYESKKNAHVILAQDDFYTEDTSQWIGNGNEDIVGTISIRKDNKMYIKYTAGLVDDNWYAYELEEESGEETAEGFLKTITKCEVEETSDGYVLTGKTDPESGEILLQMLRDYRLSDMTEFQMDFMITVDKEYNCKEIKFFMKKPYKIMPNKADSVDENWIIKVANVNDFNITVKDLGVEQTIELPEEAENAIVVAN